MVPACCCLSPVTCSTAACGHPNDPWLLPAPVTPRGTVPAAMCPLHITSLLCLSPRSSRPREGDSPVLDQGDDLRVGFPDDALPVHLDQPVPCRAEGEDSVTTAQGGAVGTWLSPRSLTAGFEHDQSRARSRGAKGAVRTPKPASPPGTPVLLRASQAGDKRAELRSAGEKRRENGMQAKSNRSKKAPGREQRTVSTVRTARSHLRPPDPASPAPRVPAHPCAAQPGAPARPPSRSSQRWCPRAPGGSGGDLLHRDRASGGCRCGQAHPMGRSTGGPSW